MIVLNSYTERHKLVTFINLLSRCRISDRGGGRIILTDNPKQDTVGDISLFCSRQMGLRSLDYGIATQVIYYIPYDGHLKRVYYSLIYVHIQDHIAQYDINVKRKL